MRTAILETIIAALQPLDFVLAFWQGGSEAQGYTDEWSDLDLQVIVQDNHVQETFDALEKSLRTLAPIQFKWRVPEPTWHGHGQCFYQLAGVSPFLFIDFVLIQHSHANHFLEVERHGNVVIGFDKANLVVPPPLNRSEHFLRMQERLAQLSMTFDFLQVLVKKEINRGRLIEALTNYHAFTLRPLVELLNMVHRPYRYDFRAKYFSRDLPAGIVTRVEPLYCITDLANLIQKQHLAEAFWVETLPDAKAKLKALQGSQ
ncbi:nucleotidyltransferase domain-containing protein [Leptolyngbya sp. FACHB-261]|uniref:nucleotidyltransferase domain-containing protein n=1 Tax=Leptolyngbya sp. FACHB-261 TaxID=2692806 RepID=UPI001687319D|nr:nucleotidyltransferase domain-containing protein [Leptolyngbya sp. FACHB-261]MBD2101462.1 nucleotidyltransferase domain-containing protein [Leptolyngbya sp. FACHB-261]